MAQADTFDLRHLHENFGDNSGFTDAQLLAGLTVPAILAPSRRSIGPAAPKPAPLSPERMPRSGVMTTILPLTNGRKIL